MKSLLRTQYVQNQASVNIILSSLNLTTLSDPTTVERALEQPVLFTSTIDYENFTLNLAAVIFFTDISFKLITQQM